LPMQAGATRLMVVTFPPDSDFNPDTFDPAKADAELKSKMPGFAETFEPDNTGLRMLLVCKDA